jgi:flavin-dependent dehydrogenase
MTDDMGRAGATGSPPPQGPQGTDYDVIVVGGRVAGAATAMLLARCGHRVLVLERSSMPSDTVSTHAILRSGVLQLERWGLLDSLIAAGTPPITQITLGFGDERIEFEVRDEYGVDTLYAPRRHLLDEMILRAAVDAGAEVRDRTAVTRLVHGQDGRVVGVRVRQRGEGTSITARHVIGADGHKSRVAEWSGALTKVSHEATNAVHYAYFDGIGREGYWFQFSTGVNAGLVPTNGAQCLVFAGRPAALRQGFTADPEAEFNRLLRQGGADLADLVAGGRRVSRFRGTNGLSGHLRQAWGPGWSLVGDAGYTKDPISAHGISDALRDAELCARAVDRALTDPVNGDAALDWYETTRDHLSARIFAESAALARFEWTPDEASQRMRVISEEVKSECELILSLPSWSAVSLPARFRSQTPLAGSLDQGNRHRLVDPDPIVGDDLAHTGHRVVGGHETGPGVLDLLEDTVPGRAGQSMVVVDREAPMGMLDLERVVAQVTTYEGLGSFGIDRDTQVTGSVPEPLDGGDTRVKLGIPLDEVDDAGIEERRHDPAGRGAELTVDRLPVLPLIPVEDMACVGEDDLATALTAADVVVMHVGVDHRLHRVPGDSEGIDRLGHQPSRHPLLTDLADPGVDHHGPLTIGDHVATEIQPGLPGIVALVETPVAVSRLGVIRGGVAPVVAVLDDEERVGATGEFPAHEDDVGKWPTCT